MLKKISYSNNIGIKTESPEKVLASQEIVDRLSKLAKEVKAISPKSDDFLYFSIIFLKAAESSLLDDYGSIKKLANGEEAWGFFDENWRWHGNVKPHKNNNSDIFPASELKVAAKKWIGLPLCRDHESSSVDGIRGIILDAHYDEKFKQVVGLCALDRVNYPDLARKVETGLVRFGSMGTAVEVSICSECGNKATTQKEYCQHVLGKVAHGEINVGLKPIEYSLVVQPAEPGAILLKCLASLESYKSEFSNIGVENVDEMLGSLNEKQAEHLDKIMKTACGENGCSIPQRKKIITSFLQNNGLIKNSADNSIISKAYNDVSESSERFTTNEEPDEIRNMISGVSTSSSVLGTRSPTDNKDFNSDGDILKVDRTSSVPITSVAGTKPYDRKTINTILEDIMSENNLRKRAELRRRIAYMQGGDSVDDKSYREPSGFKSDKMSETVRNTQDRHLLQDGDMQKLTREDMALKEKMSRASARQQPLRKVAYTGPALTTRFTVRKGSGGTINKSASLFEVFAGGKRVIAATAGEIFGSELNRNWDWIRSEDYGKQVCREIRASGLPYVSSLLKSAQQTPPAADMGMAPPPPAADMGMAPPPPAADMGMAPPPAADMGMEPDMGADDMQMPEGDVSDEEESSEESESPSEKIDEELTSIETAVSTVRDLVNELKDKQEADVDVNVFTGKKSEKDSSEEGKLSLSRHVYQNLLRVYAQLDSSADELAMVAETYDNLDRLTASQRAEFKKLASDARIESAKVLGEALSLSKVAKQLLSQGMKKRASSHSMMDHAMDHGMDHQMDHMMDHAMDHGMDHGMDHAMDHAMDHEDYTYDSVEDESYDMSDDGEAELISAAMDLRRSRRESLVKQAQNRILASRSSARKSLLKRATKNEKMDHLEDDTMDHLEDDGMDHAEDKENDLNDMSAHHTMSGMQMGMRSQENMPSNVDAGPQMSNQLKPFDVRSSALNSRMQTKKAEEERENYRIKLRRAYDVGMDMQRKGLLPNTKTALDRQVDDIMEFDDNAFEAFKRSVANAKPVKTVKVASDLGGINVGVESDSNAPAGPISANKLLSLWD